MAFIVVNAHRGEGDIENLRQCHGSCSLSQPHSRWGQTMWDLCWRVWHWHRFLGVVVCPVPAWIHEKSTHVSLFITDVVCSNSQCLEINIFKRIFEGYYKRLNTYFVIRASFRKLSLWKNIFRFRTTQLKFITLVLYC